jgi:hypothetical protein
MGLDSAAASLTMSASGLGRVKTLCRKRSEAGQVMAPANFFDFDYVRITTING